MNSPAPPRRRGYTPTTWRLLDSDVSGDAGMLLLRLRRLADRDERDGYFDRRDIASLVAFHGLQADAVTGHLDELVKLGFLEREDGLYRDVEFLEVCRSSSQREEQREYWRQAQRLHRNKPKGPPSSIDKPLTSTTAPSLAPSLAPSATDDGLQADASSASETDMPRQDDEIVVTEVFEEVTGRRATLSDITHVAWWLDTYARLTPSQITEIIRHVHARETTKGNTIKHINYFDAAIRDANDKAKPQRDEQPSVHGENEPEPSNGNGHVSPEQLERFRQQVSEMAARKGLPGSLPVPAAVPPNGSRLTGDQPQ